MQMHAKRRSMQDGDIRLSETSIYDGSSTRHSSDSFSGHTMVLSGKESESGSVAVEERANVVIQADVKKTWKSYLWDTFDKSPEERRFLTKLDGALLTFAALGCFIKYLDQMNINSAFVSGMREDLGLYGNQLNYMTTAWTVGYIIGEVPSNLILTRVRPSIWIPSMEVVWAVLTMLLSTANSATHIYVLRFFIGLAESTFFPGMQYVFGSWYRKDELAKRNSIFNVSAALAMMFSGYLMAAVYNLNGVGGHRGWQWLFIMDGVISLPIAVLGFMFIPDTPENTRAFYLKPEEREYSRKRMELEGRKSKEPYTKAKFKKIFTSWRIYLLSLLAIVFNNANPAAPTMQLYLKVTGYTVTQINTYPSGIFAVQIVCAIVFAWASDSVLKGRRWPGIVFAALVDVVSFSSLAAWDVPEAWRWICYYLGGVPGAIAGLMFAWAHEICSDDNEERALVVATMNEAAYVVQAWLPLIVWQTIDLPKFTKGYTTIACLSGVLILVTFAVRYMHQRELLQKRQYTTSDTESDRVETITAETKQ